MTSGYFDYASATPLDEAVFEAMRPFFTESFYNPSAVYGNAENVHKRLEQARSQVAAVLGVKSQEILFTSGCTEANNLAISGVMRQFPDAKVLISSIEHDSVSETAKQYSATEIVVNAQGVIELDKFAELLTDDVVLVSVMYANNEIGTIQPLREVGAIIANEKKRRGSTGLPLYFHTDAAQAANYLDLHIAGLKVDMMSLNGGKIYGPKGSGCLFVSNSVNLTPLQYGGGQERGLRSGTENIAACVGFATALEATQAIKHNESTRLAELQSRLLGLLDGCALNGGSKKRLPNNLNIRFQGIDNERVVFELDSLGFMVSSGSACHAKSGSPSRVLESIGLDTTEANSSLRITMGRHTTLDDVDKLATTLLQLVAKNR